VKGFLIDTNVLSELRKGARANVNVRRWFEGIDETSIYLSVLVTGEIRRGILSASYRWTPRLRTPGGGSTLGGACQL